MTFPTSDPILDRLALLEAERIERVASGAAWLDATVPGWERRIDLGDFNVNDVDRCVCGWVFREAVGHLFGHSTLRSGFDFIVTAAEIAFVSPQEVTDWVWSHGFMGDLTHLWERLLKERFNSGNFSDWDD